MLEPQTPPGWMGTSPSLGIFVRRSCLGGGHLLEGVGHLGEGVMQVTSLIIIDFGVQEALKSSQEGFLALLELWALQSCESLADTEALIVGCEAKETGPGGDPEDHEGH